MGYFTENVKLHGPNPMKMLYFYFRTNLNLSTKVQLKKFHYIKYRPVIRFFYYNEGWPKLLPRLNKPWFVVLSSFLSLWNMITAWLFAWKVHILQDASVSHYLVDKDTYIFMGVHSLLVELDSWASGLAVAKLQIFSSGQLHSAIYSRTWSFSMNN